MERRGKREKGKGRGKGEKEGGRGKKGVLVNFLCGSGNIRQVVSTQNMVQIVQDKK